MLGRKKSPAVESRVAAGMRIEGHCAFSGTLRIDGTVIGNVIAEDGTQSTLVLGEAAHVEGELRADHVIVDGTVSGPVQARELLELRANAHITGDVRYKTLEMQPGAVVAGELRPELTPISPPALVEPELAPVEPAQATRREPTEPTLDPNGTLDLG